MREGIFVTGGSGFVGRTLLTALAQAGRRVTMLSRQRDPQPSHAGTTVITGDLLEPGTYRDALRSCDVVIHLAAAIGRASADDHMRVNARGTDVLLDECRQAGVSKVLFVSTIATTFADKSGYHYAQAKILAEEAVSRSGLRFTILRPTIIIGPGAPVVSGLEKLALLPLVVVPGNGRVRVQPVHVDEVARSITDIVRLDRFAGETLEIGGPDVVTIQDLLQQLRRARTGRTGRVLHVPLGVLRVPLRVAEALGLAALLPISAGQLSSFRFDGVASSQPRSAAEMAAHPIDAECRVFTAHLLGCEPDHYVSGCYRDARTALPALCADGRFDEALLAFARISPLCAKIADSYASLFFRHAALRKRLVLLLAILETRPPYSQVIDHAVGGPLGVLIVRIGAKTAAALLSLIVGTLIFVPARVALAIVGKGAR